MSNDIRTYTYYYGCQGCGHSWVRNRSELNPKSVPLEDCAKCGRRNSSYFYKEDPPPRKKFLVQPEVDLLVDAVSARLGSCSSTQYAVLAALRDSLRQGRYTIGHSLVGTLTECVIMLKGQNPRTALVIESLEDILAQLPEL
jgi:hypothetical protein